ncbi:MAG TPA: hypothetical protein VGM88_09675 [Kofleriaceae bacterium]|jgi:hypothetical protein
MNHLKSNSIVRWIASAALFVTVSGVLSGCIVESRRSHWGWHHRGGVIVVR